MSLLDAVSNRTGAVTSPEDPQQGTSHTKTRFVLEKVTIWSYHVS